MPGGRHSLPPADSALTVADIVSAREDFHRSRRRADGQGKETSWRYVQGPFIAAALVGVVAGAAIPPSGLLPGALGRFSNILGWVYFLCWAAAEYPVLYFNSKSKAASEDSLDQVVYYLIGNLSYTTFTSLLLWSKLCRRNRGGCSGRADSIHLNDTLYSIHSTVCTLVLLIQLVTFSRRKVELSLQCWVVMVSVAVIGSGGLILALQDSNYLSLPAYLYGLSFLRVGSCIMEQMPSRLRHGQEPDARLKSRVQISTQWALLAGGLFAVAQQVLDAAASRVWSILSANLTKLALGVLTAGFSATILLMEHMNMHGGHPTALSAASSKTRSAEQADELTIALLGGEEHGSKQTDRAESSRTDRLVQA